MQGLTPFVLFWRGRQYARTDPFLFYSQSSQKWARRRSTPRVRQELARDWWLVRQGRLDGVTWEFTPSPITGQVGPSAALLQKIQKLGLGINN